MASTARAKQDEKEYFDDVQELDKKVSALCELILKSKHCVVFTGAGISTSSGIKDFRSGINTKLETGAGIWAIDAAAINNVDITDKEKDIKTTKMLSALPSLSHMAIAELMNKDIIKFCISQNVDGLHIRSGVPRNKIAELHGNTTIEICEKCNAIYHRDFDVIRPMLHKTGRICSIKSCKGDLVDTIINFGETLPESELTAAQNHTEKGDLCIALGSSLTVTPAADFAAHFGDKNNKKDLVIINLQETRFDDIATVRIFGKIDEAFDLLCKKLKCKIPKWILHRYVMLKIDSDDKTVNIDAMNENWSIPSSIFKSVVFKIGNTMQFKGDSKWLTEAKNKYNENKKNEMKQDENDMKERELLELKKSLGKCDKSLKRYAKMIYEAGYHTVDSLSDFRMNVAVEIMQGSNNYERRKLVNTFSKPLITDMDKLMDDTIQFTFDINQLNLDNEQKNDSNSESENVIENYIEFEFAKNYNEPNLKLNLNKYIKANQTEYKLNMTYDFDANKWTVTA